MYLIFAGDQYYPLRGAKDLHCYAETIDEAVEAAKAAVAGDNGKDWSHVFDVGAMRITHEFDCRLYRA